MLQQVAAHALLKIKHRQLNSVKLRYEKNI